MKHKHLDELIPLVEKWAEEKGIFEKSNSTKQLSKTEEEVNELIRDLKAPVKIFENIYDDIGDSFVTLIIYCRMKELNFEELITESKEIVEKIEKKIKYTPRQLYKQLDEQLEVILKIEKENIKKINIIKRELIQLMVLLLFSCKYVNKPIEYCLELAYNVISKRTGKMVNGIFVKDK